MASLANLLGDPKCADSMVTCDGKTFFYHRAIVCTRSEVLAVEFDDEVQGTDGEPIQHSLFGSSTLERMLQFIYGGDYTVRPESLQPESAAVSGVTAIDGDATKFVPPHRRKMSARSSSRSSGSDNVTPSSAGKKTVTNEMTAHVLLYAAANHYKLPELKALSLKKFKDAKSDLTILDFLKLINAIYRNTTAADDPLREELMALLMTDHQDWVNSDPFHNAVASDVGLHGFAVAVIAALGKRSAEKSKVANEAQATASKLLLTDLNQANQGLAKSSEQIKALKAELKAAKTDNSKPEAKVLECACESQEEAKVKIRLQSNLDQTKDKLAQKEGRLKTMTAECSKLQADLKNSRDSALQNRDHATTNLPLLNAAKQQLKKETSRADKNANDCTKWRNAYTTENKKVGKGVSIINSIVHVVNKTNDCRKCGEQLNYELKVDDRFSKAERKDKQTLNYLLRCCNCSKKEYGALIQPE